MICIIEVLISVVWGVFTSELRLFVKTQYKFEIWGVGCDSGSIGTDSSGTELDRRLDTGVSSSELIRDIRPNLAMVCGDHPRSFRSHVSLVRNVR